VVYGSREQWQALVTALGEDDLAAASGVSLVVYGGEVADAPADALEADVGGVMRLGGRSSESDKCQRCWRQQESVGRDPNHRGLCARCVEYVGC
jgi:isoleucyl-tRNA synthetase